MNRNDPTVPQSHEADGATRAIDDLLVQAVDRNTLPGAVIRVDRGDRLLYQAAVGRADMESGRPQQPDDLFYLGSTSKPLAVTSILTLVHQGLLTLDQPASAWLDELKAPRLRDGSRVRAPLLIEMLSHTSGIFGNSDATRRQQRMVWNFKGTLAESATRIAQQPLNAPPGQRFCYGGASMTLAGRIAELVTGMEFDELAAESLFLRLGMDNTFYRSKAAIADRFAVLYTKSAGRTRRSKYQPDTRPGSFVLPAGGILSSAGDLARCLRLHLDTQAAESILGPDLIYTMRRNYAPAMALDFATQTRRRTPGGIGRYDGYGLGWILSDLDGAGNGRFFFHGGAFGTLLWGDAATGLGVVLLSHIPLAHVIDLWDEIIRLIRRTWGADTGD
jgi:CubicO group peptidase (beta-lactamase class C family)